LIVSKPEVKHALEAHRAGSFGPDELHDVARGLRAGAWQRARTAGVDVIPSGDFSLYDHVLDTAWTLGAIPARDDELVRQLLRQAADPLWRRLAAAPDDGRLVALCAVAHRAAREGLTGPVTLLQWSFVRDDLPLQRHLQDDYNRWAVDCFRLTVALAGPQTQGYARVLLGVQRRHGAHRAP
jgi:methionine synthase II (cobalamin-independent)